MNSPTALFESVIVPAVTRVPKTKIVPDVSVVVRVPAVAESELPENVVVNVPVFPAPGIFPELHVKLIVPAVEPKPLSAIVSAVLPVHVPVIATVKVVPLLSVSVIPVTINARSALVCLRVTAGPTWSFRALPFT